MLKKPYDKFFDKEVKHIKKKYNNYIFYPSSIEQTNNYIMGVQEKSLKENYPQSCQNFIKKKLKKIIEYKNSTVKNQNRAIKILYKFAIDDLSSDGALWREASRSKWSWRY